MIDINPSIMVTTCDICGIRSICNSPPMEKMEVKLRDEIWKFDICSQCIDGGCYPLIKKIYNKLLKLKCLPLKRTKS